MPTLADLREKRSDLFHKQHELLTEIESTTDESRRAELETKYDRRDVELDSVDASIKRHEKLEARRAEAEVVADIAERGGNPATEGEDDESGAERRGRPEIRQRVQLPEAVNSPEYRSALVEYILHGREALTAEQRSTLTAGVDADGGYAVSQTWDALYNPLREFSVLRSAATVINGRTGGLFRIPRVASRLIIPGTGIVPESATAPNDAPSLDQIQLRTFTLRHEVKATEEAWEDEDFDVDTFIAGELGFELALKSGALYANGTGSASSADTQPQGLFPGVNAGHTAASIGYDQLVEVIHSVIAPYRINGAWVMNDGTVKDIRKLKDTTGRPLWEWSVQNGQPDRLLGYNVLIEPFSPANGAAGTRPIVFGDIKRALVIRDVVGIRMQRLNELHALEGEVGVLGRLRTGAVVRDPNAAKALVKS